MAKPSGPAWDKFKKDVEKKVGLGSAVRFNASRHTGKKASYTISKDCVLGGEGHCYTHGINHKTGKGSGKSG